MNESTRRRSILCGALVAISIALVGCSSAATPTAAPTGGAPGPTGTAAAATPSAAPTLVATPTAPPTMEPTPAPTPTLAPTPAPTATPRPPAAPRGITWSIPCQDTYTCSGWGADPVQVNWTRGSGTVAGYRLYYTPGTSTHCPTVWHATGARRLIATFGPTYIGWRGRVSSWGGEFSIVAFNAGGDSPAAMSTPLDPSEWTCP